jgi:hypothetical protein
VLSLIQQCCPLQFLLALQNVLPNSSDGIKHKQDMVRQKNI